MPSIALAPAILRAIATGIDRLGDGDPKDIIMANEAAKTLAEAGYIACAGVYYHAKEASNGFIHGLYRYQDGKGKWCPKEGVKAGDTIYFDEEGRIPLRTVLIEEVS